MQANIYCENEECRHCIKGICEKSAVKINYCGKCESVQVKDPADQKGADHEEKV